MRKVSLALVLASFLCASPAVAGDAEAGFKAFREACGGCHSVKPTTNFYAPNLHCIVGRKAATADFTGYTADFRTAFADITWDAGLLSEYLEDQQAFLKNRTPLPDAEIMMTFAYPLEDMRANVIAYLIQTCDG